MSTDLASLVARLELQTADYDSKLDAATKKLSTFSRQNDQLLSGLAGRIAAAFSVVALEQYGAAVIDNASKLHDLAQASGVSVEALSALQFAFAQSGVSTDDLGIGLRKLNTSLAEAAANSTSAAAGAFKALGINVRDSSGHIKAADAVLDEMADKFQKYADGANKTAIAQVLLGRNGTALIPTLNEGAAGLDKYAEAAKAAGVVISTDLSNQIDTLGDRLTVLKLELVQGLGGSIASVVVPMLNELFTAFEDTASATQDVYDSTDSVKTAMRGLAAVFAGTADAAKNIYRFASDGLNALGRDVGATAAAAVQAAKGNYKEAQDILTARLTDQLDEEQKAQERDESSTAAYQKRIAAIWRAGGDDVLAEIKLTSKRAQEDAPGLPNADLANKIKAALDKLTQFKEGLSEQVSTFDDTGAAAIRYRLTLGSLSDEVKVAGAAGLKLRDSIIAQADALQRLQDTKATEAGLRAMNVQMEQLSGHNVAAALDSFDNANLELSKLLGRTNNTAGQDQLEALRKLTGQQAAYNELQTAAAGIEATLAQDEERLKNTREAGAISEIEYQKQLGAARAGALVQLEETQLRMQNIAESTGNDTQLKGAQALGAQLQILGTQTNLLGAAFKKTFEEGLGTELSALFQQSESVGDAIHHLIADVEKQIADLVANDLVTRLFKGVTAAGSGGGAGGGGWISAIAGLFTSKDSGGRGYPGRAYSIGVRAQPELFVPDVPGTFVPSGSGMTGSAGVQVNQHFQIPTQDGRVSARTLLQVTAAAARGVSTASKRNN